MIPVTFVCMNKMIAADSSFLLFTFSPLLSSVVILPLFFFVFILLAHFDHRFSSYPHLHSQFPLPFLFLIPPILSFLPSLFCSSSLPIPPLFLAPHFLSPSSAPVSSSFLTFSNTCLAVLPLTSCLSFCSSVLCLLQSCPTSAATTPFT